MRVCEPYQESAEKINEYLEREELSLFAGGTGILLESAEDFATVSVKPTALRSGIKTPSAPTHSTLRRIAPKL